METTKQASCSFCRVPRSVLAGNSHARICAECLEAATKALAQGHSSFGCLGRLKPGEPVFILRGQDKLAPPLVSLWAFLAALHDCPQEKCEQADDLAARMQVWAHGHGGKWPD